MLLNNQKNLNHSMKLGYRNPQLEQRPRLFEVLTFQFNLLNRSILPQKKNLNVTLQLRI